MTDKKSFRTGTSFSIATKSSTQSGQADDLSFAISAYENGDLDRAKAAAKRVLKAKPFEAEAHSLLGAVAEGEGDYERAARHYGDAIHADPNHFKSVYSLGVLFYNVGNPAAAYDLLARASTIDPGHQDAQWATARTLTALGRHDEADDLFQSLIAKSPSDAHLLHTAAVNLIEAGRLEDAMRAINAGISAAPQSALLRQLKALALFYQGEFEEAGKAFRSGLEKGGPVGASMLGLARARQWDTADDARCQEHLSGESPDPGEKVALHLALAARADDTENFADAEKHLNEAFAAIEAPAPYDDAGMREGMDLHKSLADEAFLSGPGGHPGDTPVFIVGAPYSGIRLVEQVLCAHGEVYCGGERDFLMPQLASIEKPDAPYPDAARGLSMDQLLEFGANYLGSFPFEALDAERITNALPSNIAYMAFIRRVFPKATLVRCHRHPLDICLSIALNLDEVRGTFATDMESIAKYVAMNLEAMRHFQEAVVGPGIDIRYEDFVRSFPEGVAQLLEACGLVHDEACDRFYEQDRIIKHSGSWALRQKVDTNRIGRHKHYAKLLAPAAAVLADEIKRYESA